MGTLVIGLTGGIACGKSTVSKLFRNLGVPIIDADRIARACLQPDTAAWNAVIAHFGPRILNARGDLDRAALRKYIFTHPVDKAWLEALLHPLIHRICLEQLAALPKETPYVILEIPLLLESHLPYPVNQIWVVDCPPKIQSQRLMTRDHVSIAFANHMISQQLTRTERLTKADVIIDGTMSLDNLTEKIRQLHEKMLATCSVQSPPI